MSAPLLFENIDPPPRALTHCILADARQVKGNPKDREYDSISVSPCTCISNIVGQSIVVDYRGGFMNNQKTRGGCGDADGIVICAVPFGDRNCVFIIV